MCQMQPTFKSVLCFVALQTFSFNNFLFPVFSPHLCFSAHFCFSALFCFSAHFAFRHIFLFCTFLLFCIFCFSAHFLSCHLRIEVLGKSCYSLCLGNCQRRRTKGDGQGNCPWHPHSTCKRLKRNIFSFRTPSCYDGESPQC